MDIKKLNEQINKVLQEDCLYEMASIVKTDTTYLSVNPDSNRGWYNEEYFKIYNASNYMKADGVARIKFRKPEYTEHINSDGKSNWVLNSKDKKYLIDVLKGKSKKETGLTNWQYGILQFNLEAYDDANREYCLNLTQDEQCKMKDGQPEKYWLPIDLPMPDYTQL